MTLIWVQPISAHDMPGLVQYIAYMIDLIAEAYGVILMCVLLSCVFGHMDFERVIPLDMGTHSLLNCSMLNPSLASKLCK